MGLQQVYKDVSTRTENWTRSEVPIPGADRKDRGFREGDLETTKDGEDNAGKHMRDKWKPLIRFCDWKSINKKHYDDNTQM